MGGEHTVADIPVSAHFTPFPPSICLSDTHIPTAINAYSPTGVGYSDVSTSSSIELLSFNDSSQVSLLGADSQPMLTSTASNGSSPLYSQPMLTSTASNGSSPLYSQPMLTSTASNGSSPLYSQPMLTSTASNGSSPLYSQPMLTSTASNGSSPLYSQPMLTSTASNGSSPLYSQPMLTSTASNGSSPLYSQPMLTSTASNGSSPLYSQPMLTSTASNGSSPLYSQPMLTSTASNGSSPLYSQPMITFSSSVFADSTQLASVNDSMSCCNTIKVGADWSRDSRKRLALLKAASDPKQCKITTLYQTVMQKVSTVPELEDVLQTAQQQGRGTQFGNISAMLKELILNAEKNASKCRQAIRHQIIVKKFATSMLIYCGPMAYHFLHCNLPNAMPSLRSVQHIVTRNYKTFIEGEFRFDDLLAHLNSFNAPKIVSLSEDATRIIGRIEYDCDSDKLVGFVLPCNDKGIPLCNFFMATTFESIEEALERDQ